MGESEDVASLWQHIKHQDKQIQLKRRWLLGLPTSKSQKKLESPEFLNSTSLLESLLREDDMFYGTLKSCVSAAFGACDIEAGNRVFQDGDMQLLEIPNISRALSSCLDDLTNKGLYRCAIILTGGSVKFEKTRWKMKRIVKESLPKVFGDQCNHNDQTEISQKLSQLLSDPQYYRDNCITLSSSRSQSRHAAVRKVLDGLWDLPKDALLAMHRKLRSKESLLELQRPKSGWNRESLIKQVRKTSEMMLSKLGTGKELPEPLAKAMEVEGLSRKLMAGFPNSVVTEFQQFSPEIKLMQDEIGRAIGSVKTKIGIAELKRLKILLDPNSGKISNRRLRTAIEGLLTGYLFDCGDMDTIPKSVLEAVDVINRNSGSKARRRSLKNEIEKEVECILNVSAEIKQVVWDMVPDDHDLQLDLDFDDAYMEELEESDDDDGHRNNVRLEEDGLYLCEASYHEAESNGECKSSTGGINREVNEASIQIQGQGPQCSSSGMDKENLLLHEPEHKQDRKNQYLEIQEDCDETSMITYNLIGRLLEKFAKAEMLDLKRTGRLYLRGDCATEEEQRLDDENDNGCIIVGIVEDLIPCFPKSGTQALRKLAAGRNPEIE